MKKTLCATAAMLALLLSGGTAQAGLFDQIFNSGCDTTCDASLCDTDCCDSLCDTGCDSACAGGLFSGIGLRQSDHCFDDFISPMSNFVFFEDPRTLTELRPIFVHHKLPNNIGAGIDGGEAQLLAAQFRIALTERLSLIAVKDGYIWAHNGPPMNTVLNDGWADISAGLKYNLVRDVQNGTLLSVGTTYEIPLGDHRAQQSIADGEFHIFSSFAQRLLGGDAHYMTTLGWRLPVDGTLQSESIHWSNHIDFRLTDKIYAVTEVVWWHWIDAADNGLPLAVAGQDLLNLSTTGVQGNDLVTQSVGFKYKPSGKFEAGLAYEFPLTDFKDIIENRIQVDLIFRY